MISLGQLPLLLASSLVILGYVQAAPTAENPAVDAAASAGGNGDVHAEWTWLHFQDCDRSDKIDRQQAIKQAHEDAVAMAEHVKQIDFGNDPGALEFFGPSALNKDWQKNIRSVFEHISTFRLNSVFPGYRMNARCKEVNDQKYHGGRCAKGAGAYQWNTNKNSKNPNSPPFYNLADAVSNMHFCEKFFYFESLNTVIDQIKVHDDFRWRYDLSKYNNQAYIILHEMMHATVMTYAQNRDRRITDMSMTVYEYKQGTDEDDKRYDRKLVRRDVYGALNCKILARTAREYIAKDGITMNADNYAQYALAKYVQSKLDNQYPWLPIADREAVDWDKRSTTLFLTQDDGTFGINGDRVKDTSSNSDGIHVHDLGDDEVIELSNKADTDTLAPESDYPDSFNSELKTFSKYFHVPDPTCARTGSNVPSGRSSFTTSDADESIRKFCNDKGLWGNVFTPPINTGTGRTKDGKSKALGASAKFSINGNKDNLWIGAFFGSGSCTGFSTWPPRGQGLHDTDLCLDRLRTIVNKCDTDTSQKNYGGSLQETCLVYQVMAVSSDKSDPTGVIPDGDYGAFKCKDTDKEMGSQFANTCTCWFEKLSHQTNIFGKPKKGNCASMNFRPAWSYSEDPEYRPEFIEAKKGKST